MTRYHRYTLKGAHSPEAVYAALGAAAAHGLIVRLDTSEDETHVIVAADTPPHASHAMSSTIHPGGEVPEEEVLRVP